MTQSRAMSLCEAVVDVAIGYGIAVATHLVLFPVFGLHATLVQSLKIGAVFAMASIARAFALRRLFETLCIRTGGSTPPSPRQAP